MTAAGASKGGLQRTGALIIFACVLLAYTFQTELAQAVQTSYHKPCFLLYLTHSGFIFIFPVRLLTLRLSGKSPARIRVLLEQLGATLKAHLLEQRRGGVKQPRQPRKGLETLAQDGEGDDDEDEDEEDDIDPEVRDGPFPHGYFLATILISTLLITFPALSWYLAVALTNPTIVTALFNTNALWALVLAHYLLEPKGTPWKRSTLLSVLCAVLGVFVIAWGDYVRDPAPAPQEVAEEETGAGSHLAGSFLALLGSFGYALYEVSYKWKMALPEPHDGAAVEPAPDAVKLASAPQSPVADRTLSLPDAGDTPSRPLLYNTPRRPSARPVSMVSRPSLSSLLLPDHVNRPVDLAHISPTIFLLHADLITTLIGLTTVLLLWIPLPLLNALGWEVWESPFGKGISLEIIGMVAMGVVFNAGFMILLGLWGPITVSVGNLCTLVLVAIFEAVSSLFASSPSSGSPFTFSSLLGSALILGAFGIMMSETFQRSRALEREKDEDERERAERIGRRRSRSVASGLSRQV